MARLRAGLGMQRQPGAKLWQLWAVAFTLEGGGDRAIVAAEALQCLAPPSVKRRHARRPNLRSPGD